MSTHDDSNDQQDIQPESSGIQAKPVLAFLTILTVSTVFVFVIIWGLLFALGKLEASNPAQPATRVTLPEGKRKLPPEPRLQGAPGPEGASLLPLDDMKEYRQRVNEKAESYGWVNKDAGIARIPIDRAKDLIVERGLPLLSDAGVEDVKKAEAARKQVLNAGSSAGRTIRKQ